MRYVLSDIHGHYKKFLKMLTYIELSEKDTLYVLGDMIDRGDEPIAVVQHIMGMKNVEVIAGNHEQLMLDVLAEPDNEKAVERWYRNGGEVTHNQYKALTEQQQNEMRQYLEGLPLYKTLEAYVLVHAGIRPQEKERDWESIKDEQTKRDLIWIREDFIQVPTHIDKKVIFGHTQTFHIDMPGCIWFGKDKIGIDCGVYSRQKGGRLGCLALDTMQTYYVE